MDAPPPFPAQDILANSMEEIITNTATKVTKACSTSLERKHIRPHQKERALNCPRCNSTNTKFCYYNNYSLTQPRYFCKTCRRYWTQGGSLRNIPVGGKIRKNKRLSSSSSSKTKLHDIIDQPSSVINISTNPNPKLIHYHAQDLNMGDFTSTHMHLPNNIMEAANSSINTHFNQTINASNNASYLSAMERLTGINPFIPMQRSDPSPVYEVGFPFQGDFRPSFQGVHESVAGRILFPFDNMKNTTTIDSKEADDQHGGSSSYWTGDILGGAGSW